MLIKLVRNFLAAYRGPLTVVVALQFIGTVMALYLPSLNADIIDNGVVTGDTGYIVRIGARDARRRAACRSCCSVGAVWFGARTAMGFGRDVRAAIFHRVGTFSQREVQHFGAPSPDHPRDQRRAAGADARADVVHPDGDGADHDGRRHRDGDPCRRRPVVAGRGDGAGAGVALGLIITRMVPSFRLMQEPDRRGQPAAARADHRRPRGAGLRPRTAGDRALRRRQRRPHRASPSGPAAGWP